MTESESGYGQSFWLAYVSNCLIVVAVSLLYRYADFVAQLGGTEFHLGWIVGVGMIGSLVTRLAIGAYIDRYGSRLVWLSSTVLFAATCLAHLAISSYAGVAIYLLRMSYCCAIAGVYGASLTFISTLGPNHRMAELVGMLGTAGFLGSVGGTLLGDVLSGSPGDAKLGVEWMFVAAAVLGLMSLPFAWGATRAEVRPMHSAGPSIWTVLRRHFPGLVLLVGVAMGVGLGLPNTFLRTFAAELDIPRIGLFFTIYAAAAIVTRVLTRRWPARFGTRRLILGGLATGIVGLLLFLPVRAEWHLAAPAIGFGCSHAILFPAIVAAASGSFPDRHRGLATILVLAAWDAGQLLGAPAAGAVLRYSVPAGLPPYPTMFVTMASLLALTGSWYWAFGRETPSTADGRVVHNNPQTTAMPDFRQGAQP